MREIALFRAIRRRIIVGNYNFKRNEKDIDTYIYIYIEFFQGKDTVVLLVLHWECNCRRNSPVDGIATPHECIGSLLPWIKSTFAYIVNYCIHRTVAIYIDAFVCMRERHICFPPI